MADADEEIPIPSSQNSGDVDLSDETQDFRFLNSLSLSNETHSLPRRGEKDFEPNPTNHQATTLATSRQAMHDALSIPRLHTQKNHLIANYHPDKYEACVCIEQNEGQHLRTIGTADGHNRVWLLPEEALYMIERGTLDIRWPAFGDEKTGEDSLPMSLQAAYASLLARDGLTLERFIVYSGLKRNGYVVRRAPTWDKDHRVLVPSRPPAIMETLARLFRSLFPSDTRSRGPYGPLVSPGLYRSYTDIYRALAIIPFHDATAAQQGQMNPEPPFRVTWDVWKPSTSYKKTAPPEPDFRVAVIDARSTSVPTMAQISALFDSTPYAPPNGKAEKQLYSRLRHGYRNVVLAVVDGGVVSYLRVSDTGFGNEKLYLHVGGRGGGKRGRGGKSGGRGGR